MKIPAIKGIIKRRVLINYRAEPEIIQKILPAPFRPKLHNNKAIAGICLIRLEEMRPKFLPAFVGISSENAAHRIAVCWEDESGEIREGVYIPRRDSDSFINTTIGGKLFSGVYHKAKFEIEESETKVDFKMDSEDGKISVSFEGNIADALPQSSVFNSLTEASDFFEKGSLGFSPGKDEKTLDGISLQIEDWKVSAFDLKHVYSTYYNDETIFPQNTITLDHALLMQNIHHEWHSEAEIIST